MGSPAPPIRVGIAGTGFAASAHVDALRRLPGVEVVAVAGSDGGRAREFAQRHGIARSWDSHDQLVEDRGVEAIHNCTINRRHAAISLAALAAGRHVLSEKPLAMDTIESAALVVAAERAAHDGVHSAVCFNYRHYPLVSELRGMLASGDYGRAHLVHGSYLQDWLLLKTDWNWRLDPEEGGLSRAIADIGTHWADLVQHVLGEPIVEVLADLATLHPTRLRPHEESGTFLANGPGEAEAEAEPVATEDFGTVLFRLRGGARGSFTVSQTSAGHRNGLALQVDAATASFTWKQEEPDRLWIGRRSAPNLELVRDAALLHDGATQVRLPPGHPEGWSDALTNAIGDFHAGVRAAREGREHRSTIATFREGHERVVLVEAILASHRDQRWTPVGSAREVAA
ncbi:MAG: Oxidoreductase family, NAD-binding Rossmann fold protein [Conexibacter sp.]|nr:Oxidoreductase family, NAD-binding Rossmann fold protein [Conexibacter sp.]